MSKFNTQSASQLATSYEGAEMYKTSREFELYTLVVTEFMEDKFYETANDRMQRLKSLLENVDPVFVMKLAVYAREQMYLRSVPLALLMMLQTVRRVDISAALTRVIQRADELTEALACYNVYKAHSNPSIKPIPHTIMKGIGDAFNKFDEYQFAKYNRKNKDFKLVDVMRLTHPKAFTKKQAALFNKIKDDDLATPDTWEVAISAAGQTQIENEADKDVVTKEAWIASVDKMGYMALLRNLRNLLKVDVGGEVIEKVAARLESQNEVLRSKQLPFRFYSAAAALENVSSPYAPRLLAALDRALAFSAQNVGFIKADEPIAFICDVSGSMSSPISGRSDVEMADVGAVLAAVAMEKASYFATIAFASSFKHLQFSSNDGPLTKARKIRNENLGGGTELHPVFEALIANKAQYKKVCVFTDMQVANFYPHGSIARLWKEYVAQCPDAKLYVFNLAGYGMSFGSQGDKSMIEVSGWSDKVFDMLEYVDNGQKFFDAINSIEL